MDIRANLAIIPDPRIERRKKHYPADILPLCIIAMVCGVEDVENRSFFGITHLEWLKQYLRLPHGIPGADTILRVLARIDHKKFEKCFLNWTRGYFRERVRFGNRHRRKDGAGERGGRGKAIHPVGAWADEPGLVLG